MHVTFFAPAALFSSFLGLFRAKMQVVHEMKVQKVVFFDLFKQLKPMFLSKNCDGEAKMHFFKNHAS